MHDARFTINTVDGGRYSYGDDYHYEEKENWICVYKHEQMLCYSFNIRYISYIAEE